MSLLAHLNVCMMMSRAALSFYKSLDSMSAWVALLFSVILWQARVALSFSVYLGTHFDIKLVGIASSNSKPL